MINQQSKKPVLIDASTLIIEASVSSGADVFVGYPITPANWLYAYAGKRFPIFLPAPDEITALQWISGFAATGKFGVTATSFPGFALMIETINMAYMMELPMLIILAQRLGPSTGSATAGAQGDLLLLRSCISGGYPLPVFCPSGFSDCWEITHQAVSAAIKLRTPVVLLTSKEMVMTNRSFDLNRLRPLSPVKWNYFENNSGKAQSPISSDQLYIPYLANNPDSVPPFLPVCNPDHQVRINSSTHDNSGFIQKTNKEALDNTKRLKTKIEKGMEQYCFYDFDEQSEANTLLVSYDISAGAMKDAVSELRAAGKAVSSLTLKTIIPFPENVKAILNSYEKIYFIEENLSGLLMEMVYGINVPGNVKGINKIGEMITPEEIVRSVRQGESEKV